MKMKYVFFLWIALTTCAFADTLTVFQSNTVAKAAEVNANFALLAARIDSLKTALAATNVQIVNLQGSTALSDSVKALRAQIKADSLVLTVADSNNQIAKGTVAAFLIEPAADCYLPGSNSTWLFAAGQGDVNGVTVPDLRGRFLRGIDFTVTGHPPTNLDPDGVRSPGNIQEDAFQGHNHFTAIQTAVSNGSAGGYSVAFDRSGGWATYPTSSPKPDSANGTPRFSSETRPKNIAVYWYVKVK